MTTRVVLTFEGENLAEITEKMLDFIRGADSITAPVAQPKKETKPRTKAKPKAEEPEEPEEPEKAEEPEELTPEELNLPEESEMDPAEARKEALDLLMALFSQNEDGKKAVKKLLSRYGVKKFGEIGDDKGVVLLKDAKAIKAKVDG